MKLYEINEEIRQIIENSVDYETGEISPDAEKKLAELNEIKEKKLEAYAIVIKESKATEQAIRDEIKKLQAKLSAEQNKQRFLKDVLFSELHGEKFKTPRVSVYYTTSTSVELLVEPDELPEKYQKVKIDANKTLIKKDLEQSEPIGKFARIVEKQSIVVR